MSQVPVVTVVIPVLNGEATIGHLLDALKAQTGLPGLFEIIVVDNGSKDRTTEIVRSHGVKLLYQPTPGPSAARNMGLSNAQAEIVVFTDSDTVPTRRWLASLYGAFSDPQVMLATGPILGWQPSTGAERYASSHGHFSPEWTVKHPVHPFAHGMNVAVRRKVAVELGGWDEMMGSGEDVDLCIRLRKQFATEICYVQQAVLFHKHRSTDEALWKQARWHGAGLAQVRLRHPDVLDWPVWHWLAVTISTAALRATAPVVEACRVVGLLSEERAEFERYHRGWVRQFWIGYFQVWRKRPR